jgi:hypothetical protein
MPGITYGSTELALIELERNGRDAGLARDVAPLLAALSAIGDPLDESDIRRIGAATALTLAEPDAFVACVRRLPFWNDGHLEVSFARPARGEVLRLVLQAAWDRGRESHVKASRPIDRLTTLVALDRDLSDAGASPRLCHWLAWALPAHDLERTVCGLLDEQLRPGSLLGCMALRAAEREAPAIPVPIYGGVTDCDNAEAIATLARHRARELGAVEALAPAREAVRLFRLLVPHAAHYQPDLDDALELLGSIERSARNDRG